MMSDFCMSYMHKEDTVRGRAPKCPTFVNFARASMGILHNPDRLCYFPGSVKSIDKVENDSDP
jgi:hypothetical protein